MSKEEHSVQSKKIYISSNDSLNKKDEGPIRTSQSMWRSKLPPEEW